MKVNRISFAHKNRLILFSKLSRQHADKPTNLELCSTPIHFSKELQRHSLNSKEKSPKKLVIHEHLKVNDENQSNVLKLRSLSTNIEPKVLSNISNFQLQRKSSRSKQPNKNIALHLKISQLTDQFKKKFFIFQNHITSYTIKKDHFHNLLYYLANITCLNNTECVDDEFAPFAKNFEQIGILIQEEKRQIKRENLQLSSTTVQHNTTRKDYLQETTSKISEIQKLNQRKNSLLEEIANMQKFKNQIAKQVQQNQEKINVELKMIEKDRIEIKLCERQLQCLRNQFVICKSQVEKVKDTSAKISSYVGNQTNKLIAMASEEYKNIESQIYEYASYLQCNQLASSLAYEPLSITCLTEGLEKQIKNINRTLIQNEEMPAKEKCKLMRDFLLEWMNRYKKKDEEQKELMAFKTKCVQNFIQKMKKWLDNWTLKQEYLVGLRDKFALDTVRINDLLKQLSSFSFCCNCNPSAKPIVANVIEIYTKIEENYKLGNSFY